MEMPFVLFFAYFINNPMGMGMTACCGTLVLNGIVLLPEPSFEDETTSSGLPETFDIVVIRQAERHCHRQNILWIGDVVRPEQAFGG